MKETVIKGDRLARRSARLRVIGLSLVLFAFLAFILLSKKQHQQIIIKEEIIAKADSTIVQVRDSVEKIQAQDDTLITLVKKLFLYRNNHNAEDVETLLADTLEVYMKYFRNISKKEVTKSDKRYWAKFREDNFEITEPIQLLEQTGGTKAIVVGKQTNRSGASSKERIEIIFDANKKIKSIRGFRLVEQ